MQVAQSTMGADLRLGGVRPVLYSRRATAKDSTWALWYRLFYRNEPPDSSTRQIHAISQNHARTPYNNRR